MYFVKLLALTLIPTTFALPTISNIVNRDAGEVASSIEAVASDLVALNNSVNAFHGGLFNILKALDVQTKTSALSDGLQDTTDAATASPDFNDIESLTVGQALLQLQPQIYSVLDNIISKKPDFDRVAAIISLRKTVLSNLQKQQALSKSLGEAITDKLTPVFAALAPQINQGIQDKFTAAITVYQQSGSGIPLPPIPGQ